MLRSALGAPPGGGAMFSSSTPGPENIGTGRGMSLGSMGAPQSATTENFPGGMGFAPPLSAGLDGSSNGLNPGSRRQSSIQNSSHTCNTHRRVEYSYSRVLEYRITMKGELNSSGRQI